MGMLVAYGHDLVITQLGPLLVFGLVGTRAHSEDDSWALKQSSVNKNGGTLPVLVDNQVNYTLTEPMRKAMD
jgi:hypothetical protein